ncbi:Cytoglobin [Eumeta japonica]|uniref:Cytoglobin n=1 Tax=Eumeta variegata TaxID=151549 RepID=A0A4C1VJ19_EUMVA|nr:Cytoglobin [Eumeta japonica]
MRFRLGSASKSRPGAGSKPKSEPVSDSRAKPRPRPGTEVKNGGSDSSFFSQGTPSSRVVRPATDIVCLLVSFGRRLACAVVNNRAPSDALRGYIVSVKGKASVVEPAVPLGCALVISDPSKRPGSQNLSSIGSRTVETAIFFRAYPDAKKYFIFVAKIEEEEYESNAQFKAHVLNLMGALNAAVEHLHEPDVTVALMNKLGESHRRRFIKKQNFNDLKKVLVKMLVEVVMVDQASLQSWGRVVDFWFKHIFEALEAERDDADVNTRVGLARSTFGALPSRRSTPTLARRHDRRRLQRLHEVVSFLDISDRPTGAERGEYAHASKY